MAFTLVAYYESVDPAGAFVALNVVPDAHITASGDDILVPSLKYLVAVAGCVDVTVAPQARIAAPSLLEGGFSEYLSSLNAGLVMGNPPLLNIRKDSPLELDEVEAMKFELLSNPAAAVGQYGLVWLADGPIAKAAGAIRTIRATGAATLAAGTWVNTALTFPVSLKAGKYAIVGMKVIGANLIAARLVIPGAYWRPGVHGSVRTQDEENDTFRYGNFGVLGEFTHSSPPTMDCLGATDTAQEVFLDVIYLG